MFFPVAMGSMTGNGFVFMANTSISVDSPAGVFQNIGGQRKKQAESRFCKGNVILGGHIVNQKYNEDCCWTIEKFLLFHRHFAIIDTADHLADQLFIKHKVQVDFGSEFACPDEPYRIILCKCRKRDADAFLGGRMRTAQQNAPVWSFRLSDIL